MPDVRATAGQALAAPIGWRDAETIRLLLEAGADPRRYRNDDGEPMPAVRAARRAGCGPDIVELRVEHGAEALSETDDPAALVGAAGAGDTAAVERLLALGIPIDIRGADGETALHAAAFAGRARTVRLLVSRGAELRLATRPGRAPRSAGRWKAAPGRRTTTRRPTGTRPSAC